MSSQKSRRLCVKAREVASMPSSSTRLLLRRQNYIKLLSVAWIDYRKAFDMVPHNWLRKVLKAINTPRVVRTIIDSLIPMWQTDIELQTAEGLARIPIRLKRGLFQGDSLSLLLFCLCVAPLSHALSKRKGFNSDYQVKVITHLMFMDDLKLYEESRGELLEAVRLVEEVSNAIGMQLGLRKCAAAQVVGGRVVQVNTPLVLAEWQKLLEHHPEVTGNTGLKQGYRIGFRYQSHSLVDRYLAKEVGLEMVIGPMEAAVLPSATTSSFGSSPSHTSQGSTS
jgi:hypothetical protein